MLTTYHYPVPLSRNLGNLTSCKPYGPVQACNGTALPFYYSTFIGNCTRARARAHTHTHTHSHTHAPLYTHTLHLIYTYTTGPETYQKPSQDCRLRKVHTKQGKGPQILGVTPQNLRRQRDVAARICTPDIYIFQYI